MAGADNAWITFAPEKLRARKRRSGSSGVVAVAWRTMNPTSNRLATAPSPSVCNEPNP